jgi:hypothetical protein
MQFTVSEVQEFADIYRAEYGEEISLPEARDMLSRLVRLITLVARPLPGESPADTKGAVAPDATAQ